MASIARCLRAARPSTLARLSQTAPATARSAWQQPATIRAFSGSSIREIRKYTREHEWIDLSADKKTGVIGISEFAAEELGDVVYVELPEEGRVVAAGDAVGAVESVKSAADINSPISATVTDVNKLLEEKPGTINQVPEDDSHGGGWICKVEVGEQGAADFEKLMDAEAYKAYVSDAGH
ncbi:glycine cleavage H-protein [Microdochium trichocladiopsis]|uniref:Glycine cleavage system H protein n=1 Tax=Microdochium trichocladiopsis TaxID=1682393 RepID=A0A9P8YCH3_9PEZI|nr:glycine cleavage H-protein [Microdochium trichocladiopsis]KAH7033563.1 glycine cleavage H-protein [Microdochium trichocladiopsis]